jgi:hypothetical protein
MPNSLNIPQATKFYSLKRVTRGNHLVDRASTDVLERCGRGREAGHSRPSSVEVKNEWSYTTFARCVLMACTCAMCSVEHQKRQILNLNFILRTHISKVTDCRYLRTDLSITERTRRRILLYNVINIAFS